MKKKIVILILMIFLGINTIFATNSYKKVSENDLPFAHEYSQNKGFDLNKIPDCYFYKLDRNCKYCIYSKDDILSIYQNDKGGILINYNERILDLTYDNGGSYTSIDTSVYIVKEDNNFYLFIDKLHFNDNKSYELYQLTNKDMILILSKSGFINFVGYDYIIGCRDLGIIGYQRCEFKKVFKNGKIELDGEYKIINRDNLMQFPNWKFYELTNDLQYDIYIKDNNKYEKCVAKKGERVRALSTDAKTYILIETEKGNIGKVKVEKVDIENDYNFIVNGKLFMDYYFLDSSKRNSDVFAVLPDF